MKKIKITVVLLLIILSVIFLLDSFKKGSKNNVSDSNVVIVDSWGGLFQDAQRKAIFEPFTKETGIKVIELSDGENIFAKVKVQVESNNVQIDVFHADASWLGRGEKDNILNPIDFDIVKVPDLYEEAVDPYGIGILYWSYNIVYNSQEFATHHPSNWKEFWEWTNANKGRGSFNGGRPNHGIEAALMSKGYSINEVYPLTEGKIDEALELFDKNKNGFMWYSEGGQGQQLFSNEEVVIGEFFGGDAFMLADKGVPLNLEWNQGIYSLDYWLVAKNAPNKDNAMKFIEFASRPEQQAKLAELTYYGPVNKKAFDSIKNNDLLKKLPSYPENKKKMLLLDYKWWGQHEDELLERWNKMLSK